MKLTMLGTGNAIATECYNTCFVLEHEGRHLLVDAGGGNQVLRQLKAAGYNWMDMRQIFVTHKHLDHIMGVVWMMRMILQFANRGIYQGEATIYGHDEVIDLLREFSARLLKKDENALIGKRLHLVTLTDGQTFDALGQEATAFDIHSTKAKQFGFCLTWPAAQEGASRGPAVKRLVCCGDEPYNDTEEPYAKDCDWLLHEAFCLYEDRDRFHPYQKHHSTVRDGSLLAERLGVKNLVLYHTEDTDLAHRKERYTREARQLYHGNVFVPDDLESIELG